MSKMRKNNSRRIEFPKRNFRNIENVNENLTKVMNLFERKVVSFKSNRISSANAEISSRIDSLLKLAKRSKYTREKLSKDIVKKLNEIGDCLESVSVSVCQDLLASEITKLADEIKTANDDVTIGEDEKRSRIVSLLESMKKSTDDSLSNASNVEERLDKLINDLICIQKRIRNETDIREFSTLTNGIKSILVHQNSISDAAQLSSIAGLFDDMEEILTNMDIGSKKILNDLNDLMYELKKMKTTIGTSVKTLFKSLSGNIEIVKGDL